MVIYDVLFDIGLWVMGHYDQLYGHRFVHTSTYTRSVLKCKVYRAFYQDLFIEITARVCLFTGGVLFIILSGERELVK